MDDNRLRELLDDMSLEEKIGQTVLYGSMGQLNMDDMRAGKIGALLNVPDVKKANEAFCAEHGISSDTSMYPLVQAPSIDRTTVHLSMSMPKFAVEALDRKAKLAGMTRSGFVQSIAMS